MSKQSEAKKRQMYVAKPLSRRCRVCKHVKIEKIEMKSKYYMPAYFYEKFKCGIGNFKVTPNAICNEFIKAEPEF